VAKVISEIMSFWFLKAAYDVTIGVGLVARSLEMKVTLGSV
jgi:hypothetical protein